MSRLRLSRLRSRSPHVRIACGLALLTALCGTVLFASHRKATAEEPAPASRRLAKKLVAPMAVDWKYTSTYVPNNAAGPALADDTAYFAAGKRVYAVDLKTGGEKWKFPPETDLAVAIRDRPAVHDGVVYFGTDNGLYALNAADGKPSWPYFNVKNGVNTTPKVEGSTVYFISEDHRFYALNAKTGESLGGVWNRGGRPGVEIHGDISGDFTIVSGILYYTTSNDMTLHAVDLTTLVQKWAAHVGNDVRTATPMVSGEAIYLASGTLISAYRTSSGRSLWTLPLRSEVVAPPAVDAQGSIYFVNSEGNVFGLDARGKLLYKQPAHVVDDVRAAPVLADGLLVVGTLRGNLYVFDSATGALQWSYLIRPSATETTAPPSLTNIYASPVVSGDSLYVLTDDGALTAFRHGALDTLPPVITPMAPMQGDYVNARPPFRIMARVLDEGSGVNPDTLVLSLDNKPVKRKPLGDDNLDKEGFTYNPDDGTIEYTTLETQAGRTSILNDGHHTITVEARDWVGNKATKSWLFTSDDTLPRRARPGTGTGTPGGPGAGAPPEPPGRVGPGSSGIPGAPGRPGAPGGGNRGRRGGRGGGAGGGRGGGSDGGTGE